MPKTSKPSVANQIKFNRKLASLRPQTSARSFSFVPPSTISTAGGAVPQAEGLLVCFSVCFRVCHSKTSFIGLVTKGHRSIGLEEGARRARRRRNRWHQAMTPLSRGAIPSTEGSAQPSTTLEVSSSRRARA